MPNTDEGTYITTCGLPVPNAGPPVMRDIQEKHVLLLQRRSCWVRTRARGWRDGGQQRQEVHGGRGPAAEVDVHHLRRHVGARQGNDQHNSSHARKASRHQQGFEGGRWRRSCTPSAGCQWKEALVDGSPCGGMGMQFRWACNSMGLGKSRFENAQMHSWHTDAHPRDNCAQCGYVHKKSKDTGACACGQGPLEQPSAHNSPPWPPCDEPEGCWRWMGPLQISWSWCPRGRSGGWGARGA